jgi:dTMP kinase
MAADRSRTPVPPVLENFVVLEGLDGAGTTTQLRLAGEKLAGLGVPHLCTGEPTDGAVGTLLRRILRQELQADPDTVALLFAADRTEHLRAPGQGMLARLQAGELVICDRYLFSSLAYQTAACDFDFVLSLNRAFPLPRHVVFLDTPVPLSQQRLQLRAMRALSGRRERELFEGEDIQESIRAGYRRGFALFEGRGLEVHTLDGSEAPAAIFGKFWKIISSLPILEA